MTYQPVEMEHLVKATEDLERYFASFSRWYVVPSWESLCDAILGRAEDKAKKITKINSLKVEYESRVTTKTGLFKSATADPIRLAQIACIQQTLQEVLLTKKPTPEWTQQATRIVFGSILYRLLRIEDSYRSISGFWGTALVNSALQVCLLRMLGISKEADIDPQTLVSCCTAYRDYLKKGRVREGYSYIKDQPSFLPDLDKLIAQKSEEIAPTSTKCSRHIAFIRSIPGIFSRYADSVDLALGGLALVLAGDLKTGKLMDKKGIIACLTRSDANPVARGLISAIIPPGYELTSADQIELFVSDMKERLAVYYQYALLGAYVLSLNRSAELPASFAESLNFAIKFTDDNRLDDETRKLALTALQWVTEATDDFPVDASVWGGLAGLKQEVLLQLGSLLKLGHVEPEQASAAMSL